jgi:hypothetical protein
MKTSIIDLASFLQTGVDDVESCAKTLSRTNEGLELGYSPQRFWSGAKTLSYEDTHLFLKEVRGKDIPHALRILHRLGSGLPLRKAIADVQSYELGSANGN